jgi:hypothetical protein
MHSQTSVFQPTPPAPSAFSTLRQSIGIGPSKAFPQPTPHAAKVSVTTKRVLVYYTEIPMDYLPISEENMKDKDTMLCSSPSVGYCQAPMVPVQSRLYLLTLNS